MNGPDTIHIILGGVAILACWVAANQIAEMANRWNHWRRLLRVGENPPEAVKAAAVHDQARPHRESSPARRRWRSGAAT